jgi:hypothetical protein
MRLLDRIRGERERAGGGGGDAGGDAVGGGNLEAARLAGQELLAAGAAAIERTLSGDSEAYNVAVKQQGGQ